MAARVPAHPGPAGSTPAAIVGHGAQAWETIRNAAPGGLLAKRITGRYEPGVRSKSWSTIRFVRTPDVVVERTRLPAAVRCAGLIPGAASARAGQDRPVRPTAGSSSVRHCAYTLGLTSERRPPAVDGEATAHATVRAEVIVPDTGTAYFHRLLNRLHQDRAETLVHG